MQQAARSLQLVQGDKGSSELLAALRGEEKVLQAASSTGQSLLQLEPRGLKGSLESRHSWQGGGREPFLCLV